MGAFLVAQVAVTCWQIGILLAIDGTDRTMAIRYWLPGDALLTCLTAAAVLEVLWRSMRGFPAHDKLGTIGGVTAGMLFSGMAIRWWMGLPVYADWFTQVKADRGVWNLCIAATAIVALGIACTFNRANDPRFVRFHATIVGVLAVGHVLLADVTHWSSSRMLYRGLEVACCLGWLINANLSGREAHWVARSGRARSCSNRHRAISGASCVLHHMDFPAPVLRGGFGSRRSAATVAAWMPEVHAETR